MRFWPDKRRLGLRSRLRWVSLRRIGCARLGVGLMRTWTTRAPSLHCEESRLATACLWPRTFSTVQPDCIIFQQAEHAPDGRTAGFNTAAGAILKTGLCDLQAVAIKVFVTEIGAF